MQKFERDAGNYITMAQLDAIKSVHNALYEEQLDKPKSSLDDMSNIDTNDELNDIDSVSSDSVVEAINAMSDEEFDNLIENASDNEIQIITEAILWNGLKALGKGIMTGGKIAKHGTAGRYAADFAKLSKKRDALRAAYKTAPAGSQTKIAKDLSKVEDKMQKLQVDFADNRMRGPFGGAASDARLDKNARQVDKAAQKYGDAAYGINGSYTSKIGGVEQELTNATETLKNATVTIEQNTQTLNNLKSELKLTENEINQLQQERGILAGKFTPTTKLNEYDAKIAAAQSKQAKLKSDIDRAEQSLREAESNRSKANASIAELNIKQRNNANAFGFGDNPNWTFGTQSQKSNGFWGTGFAGPFGSGAGTAASHEFNGFNTAGARPFGANGYGFNPYAHRAAETTSDILSTINKMMKKAARTKGLISASTFLIPGVAAIGIGGIALYTFERNFKPAMEQIGISNPSKSSFWDCIKTAGASMAAGYIGYKGLDMLGVDSTIAKVIVSIIASVLAGYLVNTLGSTEEEATEVVNSINTLDMNGNLTAEQQMLSNLNIDEIGRALQEYAEQEERSAQIF